MPPFEANRIQNLRCPPPLKPSYANAKIVAINAEITKQKNALTNLDTQITDIEQRYKINFAVDKVNYIVNSETAMTPNIIVGGPNTYPLNPKLTFNINPPLTGLTGQQGPPGPMGQNGISGEMGNSGPPGYWGNRGTV